MKNLLIHLLWGINLLAGLGLSAQNKSPFPDDLIKPRIRVIIDNDFGGDPDGLFQLVHQILSPSVEIRGIIGSFIKPGGFGEASETAANACRSVNEVLKIMGYNNKFSVYEGANSGFSDFKTPVISNGAKAINDTASP